MSGQLSHAHAQSSMVLSSRRLPGSSPTAVTPVEVYFRRLASSRGIYLLEPKNSVKLGAGHPAREWGVDDLVRQWALLLGLILICPMTAVAQSSAAHLNLPDSGFSRSTAAFSRPVQLVRLSPPSIRANPLRFESTRPGRLSPATSPRLSPPLIPHLNQVETLFMSRSSLPITQFGGSHFQLSGYGSTVHMSDVEFGPSGSGGLLDFRPPRQYAVDTPHNFDAYGLSLSFRPGRGAQDVHASDVFRTLRKIAHGQF